MNNRLLAISDHEVVKVYVLSLKIFYNQSGTRLTMKIVRCILIDVLVKNCFLENLPYLKIL